MRDENLKVLLVGGAAESAALVHQELAQVSGSLSCCSVPDPQGLREALKNADWDIVVSNADADQCRPDRVIEVLQEDGREIPYIVCAGNLGGQITYAAMRSGVHDYLRQKGKVAGLIPSVTSELRSAAVRQARQHADSHIYQLAFYDELTGLPNRYLFREQIATMLSPNPRGARPAAMMFIALDRFARIHQGANPGTGDALLGQFADRLRRAVTERGVVARVGREEFAICLNIDDAGEAGRTADIVLHDLAQPFSADGMQIYLRVSAGVSLYPTDGTDAAGLLSKAESAMYSASKHGGGRHFYTGEKDGTSGDLLILESGLRRAIKRGELFLQYQPNVDLSSGEIRGVEALVRWNHPEFGIVPPDRFIPLADETGQIVEIGQWVLREACAQAVSWHAMGHKGLCVAVNVSAVQFSQPDLVDFVARALQDTGLAPECLELELTETVSMQDAEATISTLGALKGMGTRIALDDFGTGYSCLRYLKQFPIDILKIDRSFISEITRDPVNAAIVKAIIALGRILRLSTIAEGVETQAQVDMLRAERCDRIQGYFLSRPLNPAMLTQLLQRGVQGAAP